MHTRVLRRLLHWSLLVLMILVIISGLGITHSRVVESLTFGLLDKATAFRLHFALWPPFTLLAVTHMATTFWPRRHRSTDSGPDDRND